MSETFNLKRREDRWLMPHEASALRAEIERLRAALREAREAINDYGLDDFEETTHETLAKIDKALSVEQSVKTES